MLFSQENLVIPCWEQGTTISTSLNSDYINMSKYDHATFLLHFASTLGTGSNATLVVNTGSADSTSAGGNITFHYRNNAATATGLASSDEYAADATATALTLTSTSYAGHLLIIEVDAEDLSSASMGHYPWITCQMTGGTASGGLGGVCILSKPRYESATMPTALS